MTCDPQSPITIYTCKSGLILLFVRLRLLLELRSVDPYPGLMTALVTAVDHLVGRGDIARVMRGSATTLTKGIIRHPSVCACRRTEKLERDHFPKGN